MAYPHKWSPISCRSSAGQGKLAGQRPTFYCCSTPTNQPIQAMLCGFYFVTARKKAKSLCCISAVKASSEEDYVGHDMATLLDTASSTADEQLSSTEKYMSVCGGHQAHPNKDKNSSGDEIANVNFRTTTTYMKRPAPTPIEPTC